MVGQLANALNCLTEERTSADTHFIARPECAHSGTGSGLGSGISPGSTPIPMYCAARLPKTTLASGGGLMRAWADFGVDGVLNGPGFLCAASIPEHVYRREFGARTTFAASLHHALACWLNSPALRSSCSWGSARHAVPLG